MKRRDFIKTGIAGAALVFVPGVGFFSCTKNTVGPTIDPISLNFCSPVDLPEEQGGFYIQYIEGRDYRPAELDLASWRLRLTQTVNGQVIKEAFLTFDEIAGRYPAAEESFFQTFQCVGNSPGGFQLSNGYFTGSPLRLYLEDVLGVDWSQARRVYFQCFDGYSTNHLKERIMNDDPRPAYLAYKFNGIPYSERRDGSLAHGYPVRMVVPEMLGMKSPKALVEIEVSDRDEVDGYWESRPVRPDESEVTWADIPPLRINSRIYNPVPYQTLSRGSLHTVQGVAVSGVNPVARMEVGFVKVRDRNQPDGPIIWQDARILQRPADMARPGFDDSDGSAFMEALNRVEANPWPAPFVWCLWEYDLQLPDQEGIYGVYARATDDAGNVQPFDEETAEENADGNNAIHRMIIQVD